MNLIQVPPSEAFPKGFRISDSVITVAEYEEYRKEFPYLPPPLTTKPNQPACVSWWEAEMFCRWAGGKLPTEAEWEYACRAGSPNDYCFGNNPRELDKFAWYNQSDGPMPVKQKLPNAWGLYDMHGNVWEWCQDWYDSEQDWRVLRGGSWNDVADLARCAFRIGDDPVLRYWGFGFRVVCS